MPLKPGSIAEVIKRLRGLKGGWEESRSIPFQTTSLVGHKVLALAPHPDDESLGCGGALALHRRNQDRVKIVFLTDGAAGDFSGEHGKDDYVALREKEAAVAAGTLGVADLEFWRIPDRSLAPDKKVVARLAGLLRTYRPNLIYSPSFLEIHPDHRAAAEILWQALRETGLKARVALYELSSPIPVNTLVDISPVVERKREACNAYSSQLKERPYTDCALGLNRYRSLTVSPACSFAEGYHLLDSREIRDQPIPRPPSQEPGRTEGVEEKGPLASIVIRTKDRPDLLRQALFSLAAQTYPWREAVVVNDGGRDVALVVEELKGELEVRLISLPESVGRVKAANIGLAEARGRYLGLLDDDDLLYPDHLAKLVAYLEKSGARFAYSDSEMNVYRLEGRELRLVEERGLYKGVDPDPDRLHFRNFIPSMTALFSRDLLNQAGPLDEDLEYLEDWDLWLRMADLTELHRAPGITAEYRLLDKVMWDYPYWQGVIYRKHRSYWDRRGTDSSRNGLLKALGLYTNPWYLRQRAVMARERLKSLLLRRR